MIKINYTLKKADYLVMQLYVLSKNSRITKARNRRRLSLTIIFAIAGIVFYVWLNSFYLAAFYILLAFAWFFGLPIHYRRLYINHYSKYVDETYSSNYGEDISLVFSDTNILVENRWVSTNMKWEYVEDVIELKDYLYLKLKSGGIQAIPKEKIENWEEVKTAIKNYAETYRIPFKEELDWEWN